MSKGRVSSVWQNIPARGQFYSPRKYKTLRAENNEYKLTIQKPEKRFKKNQQTKKLTT